MTVLFRSHPWLQLFIFVVFTCLYAGDEEAHTKRGSAVCVIITVFSIVFLILILRNKNVPGSATMLVWLCGCAGRGHGGGGVCFPAYPPSRRTNPCFSLACCSGHGRAAVGLIVVQLDHFAVLLSVFLYVLAECVVG